MRVETVCIEMSCLSDTAGQEQLSAISDVHRHYPASIFNRPIPALQRGMLTSSQPSWRRATRMVVYERKLKLS